MLRRPHRLVLLPLAALFALHSYPYSTQAVAQMSSTNVKLGSIKGRVLSDGQAVTNATVTISNVNTPGQSRDVPTNDNGDFEVKGLEPAMYSVQVRAPAYVIAPDDNPPDIVRVGDTLTLNLIKGGVITGRVLTANNDPVIAVRVKAMMIRDLKGRRPTPVPTLDRLTDDRGVFRIFGLVPGTYVVFAGGRGFSGTGANAFDNDVPTFAPSSTRDTAEEISLGSGDERTIDIQYRGTTGHVVSGNATAPATVNSPWILIHIDRLVNSKPEFRMSTYQKADVKGFEFQGIADGDYLVSAEYKSDAGEKFVSAPKRITVKEADVSGLELIVKPLASVAGAVLLEKSTLAECKEQRRILFEESLVSLERNQKQQPKQEEGKNQQLELMYYDSPRVSPDSAGRFQLRNLADGQYAFNFWTVGKNWYLRSVTGPGAKDSPANDLARNLLALKSGDRMTGLKVVITEGAASMSGQVELPVDRRPGRSVFYIVPAEKDKADEVLRYFAAPVGDDGSFTLHHIPPGRYWTVAKPVSVENETDTRTLRFAAAVAARVKLRREAEAAKSEIELKPCQALMNLKLPLSN